MDAQLVVLAQRGDRSAFGQLAAEFGDRLYALAYQVLRDGDLADEAAQEAIVLIWRDLRALRDPDRFETWAYRIVVRACYREARRRRARAVGTYALHEVSVGDSTDAVANRDELERAVGRLTADQRAVIALQYYLGTVPGRCVVLVLRTPSERHRGDATRPRPLHRGGDAVARRRRWARRRTRESLLVLG